MKNEMENKVSMDIKASKLVPMLEKMYNCHFIIKEMIGEKITVVSSYITGGINENANKEVVEKMGGTINILIKKMTGLTVYQYQIEL